MWHWNIGGARRSSDIPRAGRLAPRAVARRRKVARPTRYRGPGTQWRRRHRSLAPRTSRPASRPGVCQAAGREALAPGEPAMGPQRTREVRAPCGVAGPARCKTNSQHRRRPIRHAPGVLYCQSILNKEKSSRLKKRAAARPVRRLLPQQLAHPSPQLRQAPNGARRHATNLFVESRHRG